MTMPKSARTETQPFARMRFGKAVSDPVGKGAKVRARIVQKNGLPVIKAQPRSRKTTSEGVRRGLEDRP